MSRIQGMCYETRRFIRYGSKILYHLSEYSQNGLNDIITFDTRTRAAIIRQGVKRKYILPGDK